MVAVDIPSGADADAMAPQKGIDRASEFDRDFYRAASGARFQSAYDGPTCCGGNRFARQRRLFRRCSLNVITSA